jgi:hypothetical protein
LNIKATSKGRWALAIAFALWLGPESLGHSGCSLGADALLVTLETGLSRVHREIEDNSPALATL